MDDETAWLRGKMETDGVKVMLNSRWTKLASLPKGIEWLGGTPVPDINTDRKLFIEKSSEKLGVAQGSYAKGFLCEFKKKGIKKVKYYIICIIYSLLVIDNFCSLQGQHMGLGC